jgi:hypothetical protein
MIEPNGNRYCDRCGVFLTKENNKCSYEICDTCNEWLEQHVKEKRTNDDKRRNRRTKRTCRKHGAL